MSPYVTWTSYVLLTSIFCTQSLKFNTKAFIKIVLLWFYIYLGILVNYDTGDIIDIWISSTCMCHNLEYDERYIILGKKQKNNPTQTLVLNHKTIIAKKEKHLITLLKNWSLVYHQYINHVKNRGKEISVIDNIW